METIHNMGYQGLFPASRLEPGWVAGWVRDPT